MVSINLQKSYMTSKLASIGSVILKSLRPLAIKGCCSKRQAASYGFGDWTVDFDYIAGTIYVRKSLNTATLNSKALLQRVITDTEARYLDTVLVLAVWRSPDPGVRISLVASIKVLNGVKTQIKRFVRIYTQVSFFRSNYKSNKWLSDLVSSILSLWPSQDCYPNLPYWKDKRQNEENSYGVR